MAKYIKTKDGIFQVSYNENGYIYDIHGEIICDENEKNVVFADTLEEINKTLLPLDLDNYYSKQANIDYFSVSQLKDFLKCEKYALAKINGEYIEEKAKPMLVGGYVDAYFSDRLDQYKVENPSIYKKDGTLLKDFEKAEECINTINNDTFFLGELKGEKQKIITGFIAGVPFKCALDFDDIDDITDLKCIASIRELAWNDELRKFVNFIINYKYDWQGAIYQEIERQRVDYQKNFRLACVSKEEQPDKAIIKLPQSMLDKALAQIIELVPHWELVKKGLVEPTGCGNCPVCRKYNRLDRVVDYEELFGE